MFLLSDAFVVVALVGVEAVAVPITATIGPAAHFTFFRGAVALIAFATVTLPVASLFSSRSKRDGKSSKKHKK